MNTHTIRNSVENIKKLQVVILAAFVFSVVISPLVANNVFAASMTQTDVRFDRMKISTATTGTVCAMPATVGTETTVAVTFPTSYTLGLAATFTVSTTNLSWPTGGTAWPSIATASNVTGQVATFTSGDLTVGTLYCFNWTNSAAVTTKGSATSSNTGTVATNIDTGSYATATIADDQIVVTATVPSLFSFALSANTDALGSLSTSGVSTSGSPRTATVSTNAANGWMVWARDAYQGLCSPTINTCTVGTPTTNIASTTVGTNSTLVAGTTGYNTGVTTAAPTGGATATIAAPFVGTGTGQGGGLDATLRPLATATGPSDTAILTLKNNVAISALVKAAADYTDTITIVGAGLF